MSLFTPKKFNKLKDRPIFFTSFVSTMDGKIFVDQEGYWPIGSQTDYRFFTFLRAHADAIVDGKNTALKFGSQTIDSIHGKMFTDFQQELDKEGLPEYIIVTSQPNQLASIDENIYGYKPTIITNHSLQSLVDYLNEKGHKQVFIDGGPTLLASMLEQNLIDEIFLTISPIIFGSKSGVTKTMVEGKLFSKDQIKKFELIDVEKEGNEIFLRYRRS